MSERCLHLKKLTLQLRGGVDVSRSTSEPKYTAALNEQLRRMKRVHNTASGQQLRTSQEHHGFQHRFGQLRSLKPALTFTTVGQESSARLRIKFANHLHLAMARLPLDKGDCARHSGMLETDLTLQIVKAHLSMIAVPGSRYKYVLIHTIDRHFRTHTPT